MQVKTTATVLKQKELNEIQKHRPPGEKKNGQKPFLQDPRKMSMKRWMWKVYRQVAHP